MNGRDLSKRNVEVVSGLAAGFTTTIVTHPLDLIKLRLQLNRDANLSHFLAFMKIVGELRKEGAKKQAIALELHPAKGVWKLLNGKLFYLLPLYYRGLTSNLIGNITAWSLYFTLYEEFKGFIPLAKSTPNYFVSSTLAGLTTSIITNPIWVLKTRILSTNKNEAYAYKSLIDGVRKILQNEGILSFWKGVIPSLFQVFQGALYFTFYDFIKAHRVSRHHENNLSTHEYLGASAISKILSMLIMYPSQLVRSRLQSFNRNKEKRSIRLVCREIWQNEGRFKGFYKGIYANMLRVIPATCITFVTYESVKEYLL